MATGVGYQQCNTGLKNRINAVSSGGTAGGAAGVVGGGSFVIFPAYSTVKLNSPNNKVKIGIADFDKDFDILIVFKNSVYMAPNQGYSLIDNETIQAPSGTTWSIGTTFNFIGLCVDKAPDVLKTISKRNKVVITQDTSYIDIGVPDYRPDADTVFVFKNGVYQEKDVDYTTDGTKIFPKGASTFKADANNPSLFNFLVLQEVFDGSVLHDFDGNDIKDNSIPKEKLAEDIRNQIVQIGSLSKLTTSKKDSVVNAVNELKTRIDDIIKEEGSANLSTTDKTFKGAINEVNTKTVSNSNKIGELAELSTVAQTNLVKAINEVNKTSSDAMTKTTKNKTDITNIKSTLGTVELNTADKTVKGAINELDIVTNDYKGKIDDNKNSIDRLETFRNKFSENSSGDLMYNNKSIGGGVSGPSNAQSVAINSISGLSANNVQTALEKLFTYANNGKTGIADVIGVMTASNTFSEISSYLSTLKNTLSTIIRNKGVSASSSETLSALINKVDTIDNGSSKFYCFEDEVSTHIDSTGATYVFQTGLPSIDKLFVMCDYENGNKMGGYYLDTRFSVDQQIKGGVTVTVNVVNDKVTVKAQCLLNNDANIKIKINAFTK